MMSTRPRCLGRFVRKEKVIPYSSLGVVALPPSSRIMQSVLEWLKKERLHKYWPIFSRMNYQTIVGLKEENIEQALANIDAEEMTHGARGRILRCAEWLRARPATIDSINEETPLVEVCKIFSKVLETPLSAADEPYGISLIRKLSQKLQFVVLTHGVAVIRFPGFEKMLITFANKEDIPESEREFARRMVRNMNVVRDLVTPPPTPANVTPPSLDATGPSDREGALPNGGRSSPANADSANHSTGTGNALFPTPEQQPVVQAGTSASLLQRSSMPHCSSLNTRSPQDLNGRFPSLSLNSASAHSLLSEQASKPYRFPVQPPHPLPAQTFQTYRPATQRVHPLQVKTSSPPGFSPLCKPCPVQSPNWAFVNPQMRPSLSFFPPSTVATTIQHVNECTRKQPPIAKPTNMQPPVVESPATEPTIIHRAAENHYRSAPASPLPLCKPASVDETGQLRPKPSTWPPPPFTEAPSKPATPPANGMHQLYEIRQMGWFQPTRQAVQPPMAIGTWPETPAEKRAYQLIENSYTGPTFFDSFDLNTTWGGREN